MIDRRYINAATFRQEYLHRRIPVILQGWDWPAMHKWDADYLKSIIGNEIIEVMANRESNALYERESHRHKTPMHCAAYIDHVFSGNASNDLYMVANNGFLARDCARPLLADITPGADFVDPEQAQGRMFLWLGPQGTITPLHYDTIDILLTQIVGSKFVRLFLPEQTPLLYNSVGVFSDVDVDRPDHIQFPLFKYARSVDFELHAGEVLYLPQGHWHYVRSLSSSISVSMTNIRR